jgi:hypothetical protein
VQTRQGFASQSIDDLFAAVLTLKMMDLRITAISNSIRVIPHFPKQGIMFQDVTTLLLQPEAFQHSVDILYERYKDMQVDVIAGKAHFPGVFLNYPSLHQAEPATYRSILFCLPLPMKGSKPAALYLAHHWRSS